MSFTKKQIFIIEAAEQLFADKGFAATSVRNIAQEAQVNVAMISYYFGCKEKLLESIFAYRANETTQKLESTLQDQELQPLEKIYEMIDYYIERFFALQNFHKIMMREQVANTKTPTHEWIQNFKKRNQDLVKQIINEGQKKSHFKKNIDIPLLMATLIGTISNMVTTQHFYRQINNLQSLPSLQFKKLLQKKLRKHLKIIFKVLLTNEA